MIRFLLHVVISIVTSAIGLLIAGWVVPGVELQPVGFLVAVLVFTVAQGVLGPFVFNVARQYASPILGGIGLVTTLISLAIATLFDGGLTITGFGSWVGATLLVWVITALGVWILGWFFITRRAKERKN